MEVKLLKDIDKNSSSFEEIKHIDENGVEFWYARELMPVLQYSNWQNFEKIIKKSKISCQNSDISVFEHFIDVNKLSKRANNAEVEINDYKLTRYACYLIAQNGDSRKRVIALAQTYFAVQTRKQEISENEYRSGYKGLYNGETADDIAKRKGLRYREDILDNMGSEELAANLFRITQTESRLKKDNIHTEIEANKTHYNIGKNIREVIAKNGGSMPEELPTLEKSLKQLEKENIRSLKQK